MQVAVIVPKNELLCFSDANNKGYEYSRQSFELFFQMADENPNYPTYRYFAIKTAKSAMGNNLPDTGWKFEFHTAVAKQSLLWEDPELFGQAVISRILTYQTEPRSWRVMARVDTLAQFVNGNAELDFGSWEE